MAKSGKGAPPKGEDAMQDWRIAPHIMAQPPADWLVKIDPPVRDEVLPAEYGPEWGKTRHRLRASSAAGMGSTPTGFLTDQRRAVLGTSDALTRIERVRYLPPRQAGPEQTVLNNLVPKDVPRVAAQFWNLQAA
jgi:hypothetical protein